MSNFLKTVSLSNLIEGEVYHIYESNNLIVIATFSNTIICVRINGVPVEPYNVYIFEYLDDNGEVRHHAITDADGCTVKRPIPKRLDKCS
jgi:hypothetical protein